MEVSILKMATCLELEGWKVCGFKKGMSEKSEDFWFSNSQGRFVLF